MLYLCLSAFHLHATSWMQADVFHTFFGIAGLSLLHYEDLEQIDPAYALPIKILDRVRANRKEKTPSAS